MNETIEVREVTIVNEPLDDCYVGEYKNYEIIEVEFLAERSDAFELDGVVYEENGVEIELPDGFYGMYQNKESERKFVMVPIKD